MKCVRYFATSLLFIQKYKICIKIKMRIYQYYKQYSFKRTKIEKNNVYIYIKHPDSS